MQHLLFQLLVEYREYDFHPAVKVSRHPVRAAHIDLCMAVVAEIKNPAVL